MSYTLVVAEGSEIIRKGLIRIIEGFNLFDNIHEITYDAAIRASLSRTDPDVLIINPLLVDPSLSKWLRKNRNGAIRILALTDTEHDREVMEIFDDVIHTSDTGLMIQAKIAGLLESKIENGHEEPESVLSVREKDVLRLLARGLNSREISVQLYISPHTVVTHRKNISRKLGIKSVAGLIVYALINEIITVDEMHPER
jgi:DNA-binding NarL/FixJ family response regulator